MFTDFLRKNCPQEEDNLNILCANYFKRSMEDFVSCHLITINLEK